jgi:predicted dehydrogenase
MVLMKDSRTRLGIIGMGNMGASHANQIRQGSAPGLDLTAVCDRIPEKLTPFTECRHFTDAREMIFSGEVEAVLIATPHYDHTSLGITALSAGLHTLVEKPISVHKADCERLIAAHKDPSVVFSAMFQQRTDLRYLKLKQLIDQGELGSIQRISWTITDWYRTNHYYASGDWRASWAGEGGGVLLNQCPHQLDLWQWLFGMPEKVQAICQFGRFHPIEVEDAVTAFMEYPSGAVGTFVTTTGEAPGVNRLEVAGERGLVTVDENGIRFIRNEIPTGRHLAECPKAFTSPDVWDITIPVTERNGKHLTLLNNFSEAILQGAPLIAPAAEGIHSVELANAILYSGAQGRPVQLPLDAPLYESWLNEKIRFSSFEKTSAHNCGTTADDFSGSF